MIKKLIVGFIALVVFYVVFVQVQVVITRQEKAKQVTGEKAEDSVHKVIPFSLRNTPRKARKKSR